MDYSVIINHAHVSEKVYRILLMACISLGTVRRYSGGGQTSTERQLDDRKGTGVK